MTREEQLIIATGIIATLILLVAVTWLDLAQGCTCPPPT